MKRKIRAIKRRNLLPIFGAIVSAAIAPSVMAAVQGAIWTTVADGTEVNGNIYAAKEDVYLNGGPGKGAGSNAPGLPDGIYVFMVTDPSGKTLLSTDAAQCRQVTVSDGVITDVVPAGGCEHLTGSTSDGYATVQLFPYNDTPNNGGEYKAWLTPLGSYQCPLNLVSCGTGTFGFINSESKTDNFKVRGKIIEIDTRFFNNLGQIQDGLGIEWIDTLGASNRKYSYYAPALNVNHEAHVEAVEVGLHYIKIEDQPGCTVGDVYAGGVKQNQSGPQIVPVRIKQPNTRINGFTIFVDVRCK